MNQRSQRLVQFLQEELAIPTNSIKLALRHQRRDISQLPMILWSYGLISLQQLDQIFDWLESAEIQS